MLFNFPSKHLSMPENFSQKEALRKVGIQIKQSVPTGTDNNKSYNLGTCEIGTKKIQNTLGKKPSRIIKSDGLNAATYNVSSWNKESITLNITAAGTVSFTIS